MSDSSAVKQGFSGLQVFMLIVLAMILTVALTSWLILSDIFVTEFKPVTLSEHEEQVLAKKLKKLGVEIESGSRPSNTSLEPEPYSETDAGREISF